MGVTRKIEPGLDNGEFDDGIEDSADSAFNDDLNQENDQSDGFDWDDAYWIGTGIGYCYEEGRRKRRKRKGVDWDDSSDIG